MGYANSPSLTLRFTIGAKRATTQCRRNGAAVTMCEKSGVSAPLVPAYESSRSGSTPSRAAAPSRHRSLLDVK